MKSDLNSQFGRMDLNRSSSTPVADSYEEYSHAEVDNAKRGLPLTVANYKLRLGILNKLEYEHVAKEFRDCFVLCPKLVPMPEHVMGFKYQISKQQLGHCTGRVKEGVGVRVSIACHNGDTKELSGIVDGVDAANVIIYMVKEFEYYNVIRLDFFAQRSTFQMEYQALEMLEQSVIEKVFFADSYTGNESLNICRFEWFRPSVASNPEQAQAIRNIVNQTSFPAPYVLFGPPGTGKTSTLAEAIGQIYKLRPSVNVLAVAASNSVTNELTSRVLEIIPKKDVYRIFARSYARKIKYIDRDVLDVSNLRSMISDKKNKKKVHRDVKSYRVVLCTTSTAAQFVDANISRNHFSYIFIDECGFAKEISSLVPIMGIGVHDSEITASIVLAGDPKQLGPVILCDYLNETSHSVSLLERITDKELYAKNPLTGEYDPNVITQLRNNFRSHPALLELPNRMFYAGQLRAKASPDKTHWAVGWDRLPNRTVPLIFHHVVGEMKQDENSSSMYNEQEAEQVLSYVEIIMNDGICGKKLEQTAIGIITPYASQVRYLKDLLNMRGWKDIEVGSTEQYQGREKPIMLMSTVRTGSKSVGFLADPKRLNVSLTRAQALMIVVGDLETLRNNRHWAKFIGYCRQNNAVVPSVLEFPVETVALNTESFNSSGSDMRAETSNNTKTPEIDYTILPNQITACTRPVESGDLDADTESDSESGSDSTGNVIVEAELHNRTVETTQIVPAVTGQDNGTLGVILEIANIIVGYVLWPRRPTRPI